ncbi:leukocyte elastase inhibitor A-like [Mytilus californianus]|uniref:leukocyte elastase inhibitor A-like n=1 Tax=Mytilus californianus TaxID=6549 RepID=UPI002247EF02|nr:leukocyte elastase inhibitor A-like [Mytilus californianus]
MASQVNGSNVVFEEGIANFSNSLYSNLDRTGNEFISPYSITSALLLLMLGTSKTTKNQMKSVIFEYEEPNDINQGYKLLNDELLTRTTSGVTLSIANRLYGSKRLNVLNTFSTKASTYYGSAIELLDFVSQAEKSRLTINDWISNNTNNRIKNMIPKGVLNANTLFVVVNAIYFKGMWKTEFNRNNTTQRNFFVRANDQKLVNMMYGEFDAMSGEDLSLDCKVLQLPYKGNKISMIFVLPNSGDGLSELENKLSVDNFKTLVSGLKTQKTIIRIPKFTMTSEYDLKPICTALGFTEIFDEKIADFSEIFLANETRVRVTDARHKAYIEVNEEGSEAAAATTITIGVTSIQDPKPQPFEFVADHPFLFVIQDDETGIPLFIGRYARP